MLNADQRKKVLYTAGGSVIKEIPDWSLGSYLSKKHVSPDKLKLGVVRERSPIIVDELEAELVQHTCR